MFEKAREFREKYYIQPQPVKQNTEVDEAGKILEKQAQKFSRKCSKLISEILINDTELSLIQNELDQFLMFYYEKFSGLHAATRCVFMEMSVNENIAPGESSIFEKRSVAFDRELKNVYRRLVKNFHPDMNNDPRETVYFYRVQSLYEAGDLTELLYMQSQLEDNSSENVIEKIERLESEIAMYQKKLMKLIERKSALLSTPEYRLFMKYRLCEVRGYNFFDELLKTSGLSASSLN